MAPPLKITLAVSGSRQACEDCLLEDDSRTLRDLLACFPARSVGRPLDPRLLDRGVGKLLITLVDASEVSGETPLFAIPEVTAGPPPVDVPSPQAPSPHPPSPAPPVVAASGHPAALTESQAVALAYQDEVRKVATFLRSRLSVLVMCEKLVAPYLCEHILRSARVPRGDNSGSGDVRLEPVYLEMQDGYRPQSPLDAGGGGGRLSELRKLIRELKPHQVLVIRHLDLIGGGDRTPGREARELTELIYGALDRTVLAFADPSLTIPEVISARFAVRSEVEGLRRDIPADDMGDGARRPIADALVTADEAACFDDFQPKEVYKNIAGLNPVRLRQAIAYAVQVARDQDYGRHRPAPLSLLFRELRNFKAQTAEQFTVPDVRFRDIGGYTQVKTVLERTLAIMAGAGRLPDERLRTELVPRGFLFHGPPGTGKTLFAKAIANQLIATIRVVAGPEITDMYVGESERKLRAIFAEARRSAPAVIVFDEFDSIAAGRSRRDDGGSRAGNALVAQILTEMDGFRPEVPMLVIGTTNRLELIDKALLRPSRFEPVAIGLPDGEARRQIAAIHAAHFRVPVCDELLDLIAETTEGQNGDDIRSVFRDAAVARYCQGLEVDAEYLGWLVGRLHTRLDDRTSAGAAPGGKPAPRDTETSL
jgi:transitional endoplasmic reticulum ATPase